MKHFEILLPVVSNDKKPYIAALATWERAALKIAGGFTELPLASGVWRDEATGETYRDAVQPYRVACSREQWAQLVMEAFRLFPDQLAIFYCELGEATIETRAIKPEFD